MWHNLHLHARDFQITYRNNKKNHLWSITRTSSTLSYKMCASFYTIRTCQHVCNCREIEFRAIGSLSLLVFGLPSMSQVSYLVDTDKLSFPVNISIIFATRSRVCLEFHSKTMDFGDFRVTYSIRLHRMTFKIFTKHTFCVLLFLFAKIFAIQEGPVKIWFDCWHLFPELLNCFNLNYLHCELQNSLLVAHWLKNYIYEEREREREKYSAIWK